MQWIMLIILSAGLTLMSHANDEVPPAIDESESPNILYVIPWTEVEQKDVADPKLVIHDLMGDLYEPMLMGEE